MWLGWSRFADVETVAQATLTLGPDAGALYDLRWALTATGRPRQALASYEQALSILLEVGDRAGEAATLSNIGMAYAGLGDRRRALVYYEQALPIRREVGDRAGEAVTLSNIGGVRFGQGDFVGAKTALDGVLHVDRAVGDRSSEALTCFNMAVLLSRMGRPGEAIEFLGRAIVLTEQTEHPALDRMRAFLVELQQLVKE
ncbi:tetratricopeptide (TPR) repeat protein [Allocatelliglobosispora scoriae]|uniref:Tetratricopeptide (TPR) repeat protein n=1 Tax=Allocatelliglobosispora scoriae TaxID=643052 RepID=A0A841BI59_9ACTN|nr:tetratricopeptide repeat protein [Allocatelliglobosispora scoriae]MBB5866866.1 tetratricopeptide (TPR) repeat protein [Allocatelliglobosispora scoriae]